MGFLRALLWFVAACFVVGGAILLVAGLDLVAWAPFALLGAGLVLGIVLVLTTSAPARQPVRKTMVVNREVDVVHIPTPVRLPQQQWAEPERPGDVTYEGVARTAEVAPGGGIVEHEVRTRRVVRNTARGRRTTVRRQSTVRRRPARSVARTHKSRTATTVTRSRRR